MQLDRGIRLSFLAKALVASVLLTAAMPFIAPWTKTIPLISLILGELALICLVIIASAPKAKLVELARIGVAYLLFIGISFALLSFVPVDLDRKLFAFDELIFGIPSAVSVNILGIIMLNIAASIAFGLELVNDDSYDIEEEQEEASIEEIVEDLIEEEFIEEEPVQLASIYDLYLQDYQEGKIDQQVQLGDIERALLENLDPAISSASCIDKNGDNLTQAVIQWKGLPEYTLIKSFEDQNHISKELGAGALCQMMIQDDTHWYGVSKYRGNYLILQTANTDTAPLLETSFKVFKSQKALQN